jgi:hypothetical protein
MENRPRHNGARRYPEFRPGVGGQIRQPSRIDDTPKGELGVGAGFERRLHAYIFS